ncbi:Glutathione S-transferase/chloride channel, C-terminal [Cynara cardunculus var. scolymus]|uniref:Probable glutathione S-transferase n=1 Tax=Cynara cardunculus var. scolymus TaxID=59895 RepID=A0A103NE92_CYNCS|nr:Glutathione S-transferase/chloride channel, C-terminal [Cynara cardunculus var. scolymus]
MADEVKLVKIALSLKGIKYENFEEDMSNKSADLLKYNSVNKTVPVLVHNGNPISESLVIVQYIDDVWKGVPLLPQDPYEKAIARFWAKFVDDMHLQVLENELTVKGKTFFGGDNINLVDISADLLAYWLEIIEEVTEIKLVTEERFPKITEWARNFINCQVVNEILPPRDHLLAYFRKRPNGTQDSSDVAISDPLRLSKFKRLCRSIDVAVSSQSVDWIMADEVKLFAIAISPFVCRVKLALNMKGIKYQNLEEDFPNRSTQLLRYNPLHKKVPVLVHNGNPISESLVIVEYIDDVWKQVPIFPQDPYQKAVARFWVKFIDEKVVVLLIVFFNKYVCMYRCDQSYCIPALHNVFGNNGGEQVVAEACENLQVLENEVGVKGKRFFGGDNMDIVDIVAGFIAYWLGLMEEATQIKIFTEDKFPKLTKWSDEFVNCQVVKEILPPRSLVLAYYKKRFTYWLGLMEEATQIKIFTEDKFPKLTKWSDEFVNCQVVKEILPPRSLVLAYYKKRFSKG